MEGLIVLGQGFKYPPEKVRLISAQQTGQEIRIVYETFAIVDKKMPTMANVK